MWNDVLYGAVFGLIGMIYGHLVTVQLAKREFGKRYLVTMDTLSNLITHLHNSGLPPDTPQVIILERTFALLMDMGKLVGVLKPGAKK